MKPVKAIIAAFVLVTVAVTGTAVIDTMGESTGVVGDDRVSYQPAVFDGTGEYVTLDDTIGENETVYKTTGHAVNLTGASDSYIESEGDFELASDDTWTVSTLAYVDPGNANAEMAAVSVDGRVVLSYNGTASQWEAWYYDDGSRSSHTVTVSATGNEVGNYTAMQVLHNGTHLKIYRNNTLGEVAATDGGTIADAPVNATNWDGRLEEVRTFDRALNSSDRQTLVDSPAEQLPERNRTARAMFDEPGHERQLLLFSGTTLTTSNVTYSDGVGPIEVSEDTAFADGSYRWDTDGPQIAPVAGSALGDAPVAYASYDGSADGAAGLIGSWVSLTNLMSVVPIVLGVLVIVGLISRVQG